MEIVCPHCGREALLIRKPRYDGFTRVGEEQRCSLCGEEIAPEAEVAPGHDTKPRVFTEDDQPARVEIFADEPRGRLCRHCAHYTVNPFRQWCGLHRREVEATDTCPQFEKRKEADPPAPPVGPAD